MSDPRLFALSLDDVLRRTAARTPYPGGGAASAMACATAASLVAMSGRFVGEAGAEAVDRAEVALGELADLAQADADAYGGLLAAWRLPGDHPGRREQVTAAALRACEVPLAICRIGTDIAGLAAALTRHGNPHLEGDAYAGAQLARAGVRAAARLVELNAVQAGDPGVAQRARQLAEEADAAVFGVEGGR